MTSSYSTRVPAPDFSAPGLDPPVLERDPPSLEIMTPVAESSLSEREGNRLTPPTLTRSTPWSLDLRTNIRMVAWNVRTLSGDPFQVALERVLLKHNIDIACIPECRIPYSDMVRINKSTLIFSGGTNKTNGVGIMISPLLSRSIVSWRAVSDRLVLARLKHKHGHLTIISIYAPTDSSIRQRQILQ